MFCYCSKMYWKYKMYLQKALILPLGIICARLKNLTNRLSVATPLFFFPRLWSPASSFTFSFTGFRSFKGLHQSSVRVLTSHSVVLSVLVPWGPTRLINNRPNGTSIVCRRSRVSDLIFSHLTLAQWLPSLEIKLIAILLSIASRSCRCLNFLLANKMKW